MNRFIQINELIVLNTQYLKRFDANYEIVIKSNENANDLFKKAELEIKKLKYAIFNSRLFSF